MKYRKKPVKVTNKYVVMWFRSRRMGNCRSRKSARRYCQKIDTALTATYTPVEEG